MHRHLIAAAVLVACLVGPISPASAGSTFYVDVPDVQAVHGVATQVPVEIGGVDAASLIANVRVPEGSGTLSVDAEGLDLTLEYGYSSFTGEREIAFRGPADDVTTALTDRLTWAADARSGTVTVSVSEAHPGLHYNAVNGHYYGTITAGDGGPLSWSEARDQASASRAFGMEGYLATITSAQENDFVATHTDAFNVWIGASDEYWEGQWRWVTGPEAGTFFYWFGSIDGAFFAWAPNEPNDYTDNYMYGEDHAVTNWNQTRGQWNDLPEAAEGVHTALVEYGGMPGDNPSVLSSTGTGELELVPAVISVAEGVAAYPGETVALPVTLEDFAPAEALVASLSLPEGGGKLRVEPGDLDLQLEKGYDGFDQVRSVAFRGPRADVATALAERVSWTAGAPGSPDLDVAISEIEPGFYFDPQGHHYYELARSEDGVDWHAARAAAESSTWFGLDGYLATPTSAQENGFVRRHTPADDAWIGATDEDDEGDWRWASGPESGTAFWSGFADGSPVDGAYVDWRPSEPNDSGDVEDYASTNWNDFEGGWNDLPLDGYGKTTYLVEYGGLPGAATTARVAWNSRALTAKTPLTQVLTFDPLPDVSLTLGSVPLVASVDSGLPVHFQTPTDDVCRQSGTTLRLLAAGTCTVSAHQDGDASHAKPAPVSRSFQVTPRIPAPTAGPATSTGPQDTPQSIVVPVPEAGTISLLDADATPAGEVAVDQGTYVLDPSTGTITFVPNPGFAGTATPVRYRIIDRYNQVTQATYAPTVLTGAGRSEGEPSPSPTAADGRARVRARALNVARGTPGSFPVGCVVAAGTIGSCEVTLESRVSGAWRTVGHGGARASAARAASRMRVAVRLNALGRALASRPGGERMRIAAHVVRAGEETALEAETRRRVVLHHVTLVRPVFFASDSSRIGATDRRYLARLRSQLGSARQVRCDGFTDSEGSRAWNAQLGRSRAQRVCRALTLRAPARTRVITHGENRPHASNATHASRALNRRVQIQLTY
jgi:CshA-type fibril repeat protein